MKQSATTLVDQFITHQKNQQLEHALALIDTNAIWQTDSIGAPWSGRHEGIDAIRRHFLAISEHLSSFRKTPIDLVASQHTRFVYEYSYLECKFRHNHQPFTSYLMSIYDVENNKITAYRVLEDSNQLFQSFYKQTS